MESAAAKENTQYLENNELNKLMETLMIQITTHKPADIVSRLFRSNTSLLIGGIPCRLHEVDLW